MSIYLFREINGTNLHFTRLLCFSKPHVFNMVLLLTRHNDSQALITCQPGASVPIRITSPFGFLTWLLVAFKGPWIHLHVNLVVCLFCICFLLCKLQDTLICFDHICLLPNATCCYESNKSSLHLWGVLRAQALGLCSIVQVVMWNLFESTSV